jgi:hypothetical protein
MNAEKASKAALRHPEASLRLELCSLHGYLEQSKLKRVFGPRLSWRSVQVCAVRLYDSGGDPLAGSPLLTVRR